MPARRDPELLSQLQLHLNFDRLPMPEPLPGERPPVVGQFDEYNEPDAPPPRESFGAWLIAQADVKSWISDLAKAAKADRAFPKQGTPDDVRKRLQEMGADGDAFEALDDAEMEWSSR
jgi:hypothetical protein